jgi:hypothetical protein
MTAVMSLAMTASIATAQTPLGTAFSYQGQLKQSGTPLAGTADFQFKLFGALTGGTQIGTTQTVNNVTVTAGLFTVSIDFGATAFNGDARFLEIAARSPAGGGAFTTLVPRQSVKGTPYALKVPGIDGNSLNAADGSPVDALSVDNTGRVGIGTTTPGKTLTINGDMEIGLGSSSYHHLRIGGGNSDGFLYGSYPHFGDGIHIGYNYFANSAGANQIIHSDGGTSRISMQYGALVFATAPAFSGEPLNRAVIDSAGNMGVGTIAPGARLDVNGTTRTKILEITGADLAERFPTSDKVEPGMVVAIDPDNPGKLCLARGAYNTCVAGVVSGANEFSAGAILGNLPGQEDAPPVALSGRVYVHCDAAQAAIKPGDLLTTSDTPGHAMKVTDPTRASNAIIGKAMSSLSKGDKGLVLVLVNLH